MYNKQSSDKSLTGNISCSNKEIQNILTLADNIPGGIVNIILDDDYTITYMNKGYYQLLGYDREHKEIEIPTKAVNSIYSNDLEQFNNSIKNHISTSGEVKTTFRMVKQDGSLLWVSLHGRITNEEKDKYTICGIIVDYTFQKLKEIEAKDINRDLRILTENIPGGVKRCVNDEYFTISYISDGFLELFGYTREEIQELFQNRYINMIYDDDVEEVKNQLKEQIPKGGTLAIVYRGKCKDGTLKWIMNNGRILSDENGIQYFHCVLVDITSTRNAQEELKINEERYRIISEQSDDIIFDYNLKNKTIFHSSNYFKKFGYQPTYTHYPNSVLERKIIHSDDINNFLNIFSEISSGNANSENEIRMLTKDGNYIWCLMQANAIFNDNGEPIRAIGKIVDIDSQKKELEILLLKSQRDALTTLYNKGTTQTLIQDLLISSNANLQHALFIIDIDNFKGINDTLGHLFGDAVLCEVSSKIRTTFETTDILGRIGGDEFLVFLNDVHDINCVEQKAEELMNIFRTMFTVEDNNYKISCSIGISLYPNHGNDYTELFKKADHALYHAKKQGKNCYSIYSKDKNIITSVENFSSLGGIETSNIQKPFGENIIEYMFKIFYETKDIYTAVNLILGLIGRYFDVSRVYVFENDDDDSMCINTFEWCNEGISPQKNKLQNISYEYLGDYQSLFNENGIFYSHDIKTLPPNVYEILNSQNIISIIQVAIMDGKNFKGFVGFDECKDNFYPTPRVIESLNMISQILSTFLLKRRTQDKLSDAYKITQYVLDNIDLWTYVINMKTYELLFINKKTENIAPNASVGSLCYNAFHNIDKPCENCPLKMLTDTNLSHSMIIHNTNLNVWTNAIATKITWVDGKAVCLMSCSDITHLYLEDFKK